MQHEPMYISKRAKLEPAPGKACTGLLVLRGASVCWEPDGAAANVGAKPLSFPIASIVANQRNKAKPLVRINLGAAGAHTFEFDSMPDRDALLESLTKLMAGPGGGGGGAPGSGGTGPGATGAGGAPAKAAAGGAHHASAAGRASAAAEAQGIIAGLTRQQRLAILQSDPDVAALHKELVAASGNTAAAAAGGACLGEAEFWAGVVRRRAAGGGAAGQPLLNSVSGVSAAAQRPRVGLANIIQSPEALASFDAAGGAGGGRGGTAGGQFRVVISQDQIAQIFAEQPHVLRAYREAVGGGRMSQEDFWRRYVKHRLQKEAKRKAALEGRNYVAPDNVGEMFELGPAAAAQAAREVRAKLRRVDPSLDLEAQRGEEYAGHGLAHSSTKEPAALSDFSAAGGAGGSSGGPAYLPASALTPMAAAASGGGVLREIAAELNAHGEVVLRGVAALEEGAAALADPSGSGAGFGTGFGTGAGPFSSQPSSVTNGHHGGKHHQGGKHHHHHHHHKNQQQDGLGGGHTSGLEDLIAPKLIVHEQLAIADPRRYFERMTLSSTAATAQADGMQPSPQQQQQQQQQGVGGGGGWVSANGTPVKSAAAAPGFSSFPSQQGRFQQQGQGHFQQQQGQSQIRTDWREALTGGGSGGVVIDPEDLPLPPVAPQAVAAALLAATPAAVSASDGTTLVAVGGVAPKPPDRILPPGAMQTLRLQVLGVTELCRHFWAALPATTPARRDKASRLQTALQARLAMVNEMIDASRGADHQAARQLLRPARDMLEAALNRYDQGMEQAL